MIEEVKYFSPEIIHEGGKNRKQNLQDFFFYGSLFVLLIQTSPSWAGGGKVALHRPFCCHVE